MTNYSLVEKFLFVLLFTFLPVSFLTSQQTVGLLLNTQKAFNGYTLVAPPAHNDAVLLDNCGRIINSWSSSFRPGLSTYLLPSGQLLRTTLRTETPFNGGGIGGGVELHSWEGEIVWTFPYANDSVHQHHDVEYLENGNVLMIAWEHISAAEANSIGVQDPFGIGIWPEHIVEVKPILPDSGEIVWEWHLTDHIIQDIDQNAPNFGVISEHPELIDVHYQQMVSGSTDFVHLNAISYNSDLDQIIVNSKNYNEFWIIDHSTTTEEAASHEGGQSGKGGDILYRWGNPETYQQGTPQDQMLFGQHDAHWIQGDLPEGGKIMVFNNNSGLSISSVEIINPPLLEDGTYEYEPKTAYGPLEADRVIREFNGGETFYAVRVSGAQMQPNGNVLICSGTRGNLLEIDVQDSLVWKYKNPMVNNTILEYNSFINTPMFRAYRYGPDYPAFIGRDLTPGNVVELNAPPSDCEIYLTTSIQPGPQSLFDVSIKLVASNELALEQESNDQLELRLFDVQGRILGTYRTQELFAQFRIPDVFTGLYFVHVMNEEGRYFTQKLFIQ